ncbi:hypothetical protein DRO19_02505 [Candidatus Bathyarchaeota archaeon]|nr:MAG: hypothetical protein DRO19_02505 [Candidatus Bathyarchaeota archaeon]
MRNRIFTKHELRLLLQYLEGHKLRRKQKNQLYILRHRIHKYWPTLSFHFELAKKLKDMKLSALRKEAMQRMGEG